MINKNVDIKFNAHDTFLNNHHQVRLKPKSKMEKFLTYYVPLAKKRLFTVY
jgi:hypothetical protein